MPDAEILKVALQGGMFAVWMIFIWWLLFHGAPMLKVIFESMNKTIERLAEQHRLAADRKEVECREERRELAERYASEREKDRNARHDANNQLQVMIGRMCEIVDRHTEAAAAHSQEQPKRRTS